MYTLYTSVVVSSISIHVQQAKKKASSRCNQITSFDLSWSDMRYKKFTATAKSHVTGTRFLSGRRFSSTAERQTCLVVTRAWSFFQWLDFLVPWICPQKVYLMSYIFHITLTFRHFQTQNKPNNVFIFGMQQIQRIYIDWCPYVYIKEKETKIIPDNRQVLRVMIGLTWNTNFTTKTKSQWSIIVS